MPAPFCSADACRPTADVAFDEEQVTELRLADAYSVFQHGLEHRRELAGRTRYHLQHLGRRRLLLQRLGELVGALASGLALALGLAAIAYWQREIAVEQEKLAQQQHVATLAELAGSEQLRGNWDTALRLAVHAVHLDPARANAASPAAAQLASTVSQLNWAFAMNGVPELASFGAFSPDGSRIITGSTEGARIWDAATGKRTLVLSVAAIVSASFSPDGRRIVTASADKTARIWDSATARELLVLRGHEDQVSTATFSDMCGTGRQFTSISMSTILRVSWSTC
jgi:WD domain, G-beta repeat